MKKRATAYLRSERIVLHALSRTPTGMWVLSGACVVVRADASEGELAAVVRNALSGSLASVPQPSDWKSVQAPLLAAVGAKSWSAFAKGARGVEIEEKEGGETIFMPTLNKGREGFVHLPSETVAVPTGGAPHELAAGLREALARSS